MCQIWSFLFPFSNVLAPWAVPLRKRQFGPTGTPLRNSDKTDVIHHFIETQASPKHWPLGGRVCLGAWLSQLAQRLPSKRRAWAPRGCQGTWQERSAQGPCHAGPWGDASAGWCAQILCCLPSKAKRRKKSHCHDELGLVWKGCPRQPHCHKQDRRTWRTEKPPNTFGLAVTFSTYRI